MATKKTTTEAELKGDVQERVDRAEDQGFIGVSVDPIPNEAYSLESGPDAPTLPNDATHFSQPEA